MSTPKLLLCVEDDEDDCIWIEEASAEIDPRLVFVAKSNGKEALMFLHRQKDQNFLPCLILLDLNMPGMDGKQTLIEIKKDPELEKIPVVIFTTSSSKADKLFCEKHGADMITKPDHAKEMKKTIQDIVLSKCMNQDQNR